jgi:hypothetical protein
LQDIWSAVWAVVEASEENLKQRKEEMFTLFKPEEVQYYQRNWERLKERQVLNAYVSRQPNLGLRSTSRNEGQNWIIKMFLDHKMNLEQTARELIRTIHEQDRHDVERNASSRLKRHLPTTTGMQGLRELETVITRTASNLLKPEMLAARENHLQHIPVGHCQSFCKNPIPFGLPCRHIMQPYIAQGQSIPRHCIHPRWFIIASEADIQHSSYQADNGHDHYLVGSGEAMLAREVMKSETFRAQLQPHQAEQFSLKFQSLAKDLRAEFTAPITPYTVAFVPLPKLSKKAEELRKNAHVKAISRPMIPPVQQWTSPDRVRPSPVQSSPSKFWTGIGPIPNSVGPGLDWTGLEWISPALCPGLGYISHCIGLII